MPFNKTLTLVGYFLIVVELCVSLWLLTMKVKGNIFFLECLFSSERYVRVTLHCFDKHCV